MPVDAAELRIGRFDPKSNGADAPRDQRRRRRPCAVAAPRRAAEAGGRAYAIEDLGSTNGTEVNGRQIAAGEPVTLGDGDRVHLGAWTGITIRSRAA